MKQEAEERKLLQQQQKQVEKEEEKYKLEIEKVQEQLAANSEDEEKLKQLQMRIAELQGQLDSVEHKKEEIVSRQNGKAGYVYVISNLGSFGDDVFKVGMTRRLDPMDRIAELGSASVPFSFDVHSFIFSDDAVALEQKLHTILDDNRVNKINLRKEFFRVDINELEKIVEEIDPSAEFNKTMLAEQYRQTLSLNEENKIA
ncbi:GIY-YIG nuclease family protein [Clostridium botulinum]|uniref:GIY-YIG nuclease family protein n=2 Tax=Clostridium botulinum TaxID=1491 RepID=A0A6B4JIY8_CLOBO|nr:GIY-YIG nuclease family protein [Clostridium botulinum]MBY6919454.1 GIY-YIG nuclease family protein [Clostridium botulinum]NFJ56909.1 GIY-YIG nuclease family protein [Clostridium botulinum]NFL51458.1 GIY-YIG nuclease family protein [Clostridium botulinum]NFS13396.1 GIY-YIG nuclease family protein [Clostridium botulinum]